MWKSDLKSTFRSLIKQRGYSIINILGIAVGFTCCLLIGLFVRYELSFDRYHENGDHIYRLVSMSDDASFGDGIAKVTYPWGQAALEEIPGVLDMCRFVFFGRALVDLGNEKYYQSGGLYADASAFDMFSWKFIHGDQNALVDPNSIVLTRSMAERCFGNTDPTGKTLILDEEDPFRVTGVIEDIPANSHFTFQFLVSLGSYSHPDLLDWRRWNQFYTYLHLREEVDPETVALHFDQLLDQHLEPRIAEETVPELQPLTSIHLHSDLHREMSTNSDPIYIYMFGIIAVLILIIAALNFINLTTARATTRAKEVGVRKVIGASRTRLMRQFLTEALVICVIGALASVFLAQLFQPMLRTFLDIPVGLDLFGDPVLLVGIGAVTLITALLAGIYPAFILSSFRPNEVFKGSPGYMGRAGLRKGLVVAQFAIAAFMITAAITVRNQLHFIQNKNLGFNGEQIAVVSMVDQDMRERAETIRDAFLEIPGVRSVAISANRPGGSDYGVPYRADGLSEDEQPAMRCLVVNEDFLDTYGMEVVAGRNFMKEMSSDSAAYLINEEAARQLGWEDPLQHTLSMPAVGRTSGPIIGVVKDFHFHSLHEPIGPLYFFLEKNWFSQFSIKLDTRNINQTLTGLEETWQTFEADYPFVYSFMDQQFASLHQAEARTAKIVHYFTGIIILITCLGIFGLSTFLTRQRRKEIGVRKVLGASTFLLVRLMIFDLLRLVLVGLVLAAPVAWIISNNWLDNFAYRIQMSWEVFAMTGMLALVLAVLTTIWQSMRTAMIDPAEAIRRE